MIVIIQPLFLTNFILTDFQTMPLIFHLTRYFLHCQDIDNPNNNVFLAVNKIQLNLNEINDLKNSFLNHLNTAKYYQTW